MVTVGQLTRYETRLTFNGWRGEQSLLRLARWFVLVAH